MDGFGVGEIRVDWGGARYDGLEDGRRFEPRHSTRGTGGSRSISGTGITTAGLEDFLARKLGDALLGGASMETFGIETPEGHHQCSLKFY